MSKIKAKYTALTQVTLTKKLKDLGIYSASIIPAIQSLIDIDSLLCEMKNAMAIQGALIEYKSREGDVRYMVNPLIPEITKLEATKQRALNDLLLTPSSIKKNEVQTFKKDDDFFEDAIKNRVNETVKSIKKR